MICRVCGRVKSVGPLKKCPAGCDDIVEPEVVVKEKPVKKPSTRKYRKVSKKKK